MDLTLYLIELMPTARVVCAGCNVEREAASAIVRDGKFYCSEICADKTTALMIKPQPKGVKLNGWNI